MNTTPSGTVDTRAQLETYQKILDQEIADYSEGLLSRVAEEYTPDSYEALNAYVTILCRGGKRMRGALTMTGYYMAGGQDEQIARRAGLVMELTHAYLLVIDDVADRSAVRRGGASAHKIIEQCHRDKQLKGDSVHFGETIAVHAGLLGEQLAYQELCALPTGESARLAAVNLLHQIIARTVHGQFNDIYNEVRGAADEQVVLDTLRWKTADYSVTGPLRIGAILAGVDTDKSQVLQEFGDNLGLAFQITDDILGTFGGEQETGKSNRDDMREGKMTVMVARVLSQGSATQKAAVRTALGNAEISDAQFENARTAIKDSGALHYTRGIAADLVARAVYSLDTLPKEWQAREECEFLRGLTQYIQVRTA